MRTGTIENIQDLIRRSEDTISKVKTYFLTNGLMINTTKTQCIFIGSSGLISQIPQDTHLTVDRARLLPTNTLKNLGIYFDSQMTFDAHVNNISSKAISAIIRVYINRTKDNFSRSSGILLVQSLVLSIVNHGIKIWGNKIATNVKVQRRQNFAVKVALGGATRQGPATPFIWVAEDIAEI